MLVWRRFVLVLSGFILVASLSSPVFAQQTASGTGLTMSPTRTELTIFPGIQDTIKFTLTNVSGIDLIAKVEIDDFQSDGETGNPKVIVNQSQRSVTSIQPFITKLADIPIKKDERKNIAINVTIPKDAAPGAYYGIIRYSAIADPNAQTKTPDGGGKVSLTASIGHLVLITVPGNITKQIQLLSVHATRGDSISPLYVRAPNQAELRIKNLGNGFAQPIGQVSISNDFSGKQVYSYDFNSLEPKANILPGSIRLFKDKIKNITEPGRYTITAAIAYDSGGEVLILKSSFWYVPVWLTITIVGALLIIVVAAYVLYRRYSKHINKSTK